MRIGNIELRNQVIAAPMAGVTDKAFREICVEMGAGLVFTEMVSDKSLAYLNKRAYEILDISGEKHPIVVQIFGSEPEFMMKAAKIVADQGADIIDINMGCPTQKIVRNGEGAALLLDLNTAERIIEAVVQAVSVPVTVKTRKGWSETASPTAVSLAKIAEAQGAAAITIHGRTREQFYAGKADWQIIADVKNAVKIPVIGNGDIFKPQDGQRMLDETGCDGIMLGRGLLGNPWLLQQTVHYLDTGEILESPSIAEKMSLALRHLQRVCDLKGEYIGVREMRKHLAWYLKGIHGAARIREEINTITDREQLKNVLKKHILN